MDYSKLFDALGYYFVVRESSHYDSNEGKTIYEYFILKCKLVDEKYEDFVNDHFVLKTKKVEKVMSKKRITKEQYDAIIKGE